MNTFKITIRRLFRKGQHSYIRMISLTLGLAFGLLLLAEVFYQSSYDHFYPDAQNIFVVQSNYVDDKSTKEMTVYEYVSGAIAPGLKEEIPGIEAATRMTTIGRHDFYTEDFKKYHARFHLADEHLFDVLQRRIIAGNPKEILTSPMQCMVSSEIAEKMGADVVGKMIETKGYPGKKIQIAGIFEALPENTNYPFEIVISMTSIAEFMWDGSMNWLGNDRYYACVKLASELDPLSLAPAIRNMQKKYQDIEKYEAEQGGHVISYSLKPLKALRMSKEQVSKRVLLLAIVGIAVLIVSLLNYLLIMLTSMMKQSKNSALLKTFGAKAKHLYQLIFSETLILYGISLLLAFVLTLLIRPFIEQQLAHSLRSSLNASVILPIVGIVALLIIITAYIPGQAFVSVPVAKAFRTFKSKGNKWKKSLLLIQVAGMIFIFSSLLMVNFQYKKMTEASHGYEVDNIYFTSTVGIPGSKLKPLLHELRSTPDVLSVSLAEEIPIERKSGNNIMSLDRKKDFFNIADFYYIDKNYHSTLGIKMLEGDPLSGDTYHTDDVLISQSCAEKLKIFEPYTDGLIGKQIAISEHRISIIKGIYEDVTIGSLANPDLRPSVMFFASEEHFIKESTEDASFYFQLLIKTSPLTASLAKERIEKVINTVIPHEKEAEEVLSLKDVQKKIYASQDGFRSFMLVGSMVVILLTLIGLIGFMANETSRRKKELAIRKINGATVAEILRSFLVDLHLLLIPAAVIGSFIAWFIASLWIQDFAVKVNLHWWIFALSASLQLALITCIAIINYKRAATRNPVEALRYE